MALANRHSEAGNAGTSTRRTVGTVSHRALPHVPGRGGVGGGGGGAAASRLSSPTDRDTGCLQTCSFQSSCVWVFDPSCTSEDCCDADASTENRLWGGGGVGGVLARWVHTPGIPPHAAGS